MKTYKYIHVITCIICVLLISIMPIAASADDNQVYNLDNEARYNMNCPEGGEHTFIPDGLQSTSHPHKVMATCSKCGGKSYIYKIEQFCSKCNKNAENVSETSTTNGILAYIDGDNGAGIVIPIPTELHVTYENTYKTFFSIDYYTPSFASFGSSVSVEVETNHTTNIPDITTIANRYVDYYDDNDDIVETQSLVLDANADVYATSLLTLSDRPAYTSAQGTCYVSDNAGSYFNGIVETEFVY